MNVLWEDEFTENFTLSRIIRQGDFISPYIFVLCIERLNAENKNMGTWKPILLSQNGTPLTHLFFN